MSLNTFSPWFPKLYFWEVIPVLFLQGYLRTEQGFCVNGTHKPWTHKGNASSLDLRSMKAGESDPSVLQNDRGELRETVEDRGAWCAIVHRVAKSRTWHRDWTTTSSISRKDFFCPSDLKSWCMFHRCWRNISCSSRFRKIQAQRLSSILSWEVGSMSYHSKEYLYMKSYLWEIKALCSLSFCLYPQLSEKAIFSGSSLKLT